MAVDIKEGVETMIRNDGVIWAVFISMVVVFGFLTVVAISESSITAQPIEAPTAGTGNAAVRDVDLKIIPVE